jgi:hypothetical protein
MSEIKRYYLQDDKRDSEPRWYVSADDHLAAINQAKIEAVRELVELRERFAELEEHANKLHELAGFWIEQNKRPDMSETDYRTWLALGYRSNTYLKKIKENTNERD